jgi:hypothetical protein
MKLRIKGNSVRLRLDQRDLARLLETGNVEDSITFGTDPGQRFSYAVEIGLAVPGQPSVGYLAGRMLVRLDRRDAEFWAASDLVGFDSEQTTDTGSIHLLLEKDFACLDRPAGEDADDEFAFPNPSSVC